jgi:probable HAF family extracellular repeat protein
VAPTLQSHPLGVFPAPVLSVLRADGGEDGVGGHLPLYSGGKMTGLDTLSGKTWDSSKVHGINDSGQIVGYSHHGGSPLHAFFYTPSSPSLPAILPLLLGSD